MVIIVGWGKSLEDKNRGHEIDSYPAVIRFPPMKILYNDHAIYKPSDHGWKTDYFTTLVGNAQRLIDHDKVPNKESWLISRPDSISQQKEIELICQFAKFRPVICRDVDKWLSRFEKTAKRIQNNRPIPQTGLITALIAMERLHFKKLYLAGFDVFWDESISWYGMHDMVAGRKMVAEVAKLHDVEVIKF